MADLLTLSCGPMKYVTRFKGYIINGYRFHVQDYDKGKGKELIQDDMNPSKFKKSKMGSSSKNFKQSFLPPSALARGRGQSLKSMGSVKVTAEKRSLIDQTDITLETMRTKSEKEIKHNSTSGGFVKESTVRERVEKRTMKINVVPPGFDALEDETLFPNDDLEVMQETVTSKQAKENGQNIIYACSVKGSNVVQRTSIGKSKNYCVPSSDKNELAQNKNLMQPGFDPIEVDSFFPRDDLEVMGRGNKFTSLSSVREGIGKRIMIENNKVETSFPHDDYEVMQENMRSIPGKENRKNITSVGSARGSIFVQRTSIGKSKGYSVVSSDMNVPASNKIIRQPNFNPIEHDTSFPHDDLEAMQEALRSKSGILQGLIYAVVQHGSEHKALHMWALREGSCEVDRIKKVRGPNLCKVVTGLKPGEKLRVTFYHNRVVGDHHALFLRHLGPLVRDRNMCPLRVHSWTDIEEAKLEHMWGAATRGFLHMNMKSKPLREVLKDVPEGVDKSD
ncbi:hypothetical protein KY284_019679 [Solanum tuberosum]|nr:hypothetical protein KY284_019679 [Solanum tuberosum]